ncbi:MAG TPA: IS1182 family transposase [Enhygromyxa sp.]|nr:IS1182 family transposase [Enhygromyxa sp.]
MPRWAPPVAVSAREKRILTRVRKRRRLFAFLREHRHELFDEEFQRELEAMYRQTGSGKRPVPPALLAMVVLLQAYDDVSDAEAVERAVCDARWQLVLDCLGCEDAPFSQGALHDFRQRLIAHEMDRRLLERSRELAKRTNAFDYKKLPKQVEVAVDSSPLQGAGRVEDTFNLLAHAAMKLVLCVARLRDRPVELLADELGIPLLAESSIKKALDIDWDDDEARSAALERLLGQIEALERWVLTNLKDEAKESPLREVLEVLERLREQDLEPDPSGGGRRVKQGVAKDRRVSIEDPDMRHGRKSKTKAFNGYKRHVAVDLATKMILAVALRPANEPEREALPELWDELCEQHLDVSEIYMDRGYIGSDVIVEMLDAGVDIVCKPWAHPNHGRFTKADFQFDLRSRIVSCPGGQSVSFTPGKQLCFDEARCASCEVRVSCTTSERGRRLSIASDELLQERLRRRARTPKGRARLRKRTGVEHTLAHVGRRQGRRARYLGTRKNLYDLRRTATVVNLETIQHDLEAPRLAQAA